MGYSKAQYKICSSLIKVIRRRPCDWHCLIWSRTTLWIEKESEKVKNIPKYSYYRYLFEKFVTIEFVFKSQWQETFWIWWLTLQSLLFSKLEEYLIDSSVHITGGSNAWTCFWFSFHWRSIRICIFSWGLFLNRLLIQFHLSKAVFVDDF